MFFEDVMKLTHPIIEFMVLTFILAVGVVVLFLLVLFVIDVTQRKHTIRKNFPVIGRLRYKFEDLGVFFRQYFFTQDRDELPFNRSQRSWVYRAAKNVDITFPFGSTEKLSRSGSIIFLHSPFPVLDEQATPPTTIVYGENYAKQPYATNKLINISGMSYGAISKPAVQALSKGAKIAGISYNTGEGGLSPFHLEGGCDLVFQIGTAKYSVRDKEGNFDLNKLKEVASHPTVKMFEIKLSQGAKPGKGGMLPAAKITEEIAKIRGIEPGQDSISPNRHKDIANMDQLLDKLAEIRDVTGKPTGIKLALGQYKWMHEFCELIVKRGLEFAPDFITVDSGDGGTGAAPQSFLDSLGLPLKMALPFIVDTLKQYNLRQRIKINASGRLINPTDLAWAYAVGADNVIAARGFLFALGCIQAMDCNKNTCPTGITTHNKTLQRGLSVENKKIRVANYAVNIQKEVEAIAHACGVSNPRELTREHFTVINLESDHIPAVNQ